MFTLIGDLVGSRDLPDRAGAQDLLAEALAAVNETLTPVQPLEPTVGDEVQGGFATLADATLAALLLRLGCLPVVDVRCGLGEGEVRVHDATRRPLLQDGPGWWTAREALEVMAAPRKAALRTWFVGGDGADVGRVNAFLLCRDQLVDRLNDRGRRMLRAALLGATQREIARAEGISESGVSQQFARGVAAVRDAQLLFR
ncbi:MAG: SatD family protein [Nocardioides sp.]|nr:SatD family protein [Nocardioides sp.]